MIIQKLGKITHEKTKISRLNHKAKFNQRH